MKSRARTDDGASTYHLPVARVREQVTELEAAVLLMLKRAGKKAVHRVRTSTRGIEAHLELLDQMTPREPRLQGLDGYRRVRRRAVKALSKLRRAAGKVRDLDVQRELLKQLAAGAGEAELRAEATALRRKLKKARRQEAEALEHSVRANGEKLAQRLEALLGALQPVEDLLLSEAELERLVRQWFAGDGLAADPAAARELHALRKRAKLARYMAERGGGRAARARGPATRATASAGALPPALAARLKRVQETGGAWHDLLLLGRRARRNRGRRAKLVEVLAAREERALRSFRRQLSEGEPGRRRQTR